MQNNDYEQLLGAITLGTHVPQVNKSTILNKFDMMSRGKSLHLGGLSSKMRKRKGRNENMNEKLEKLNEYINEKLGMELQDDREIINVSDEIKSWETIEERSNGELKLTEDDERIIDGLKKYKDHKCIYAIDSKQPVLSQGFIIINNDLEYIDFVRTV